MADTPTQPAATPNPDPAKSSAPANPAAPASVTPPAQPAAAPVAAPAATPAAQEATSMTPEEITARQSWTAPTGAPMVSAVQQQEQVPQTCPYCADSPSPPDQFYETKLFRVLVARNSLVEGQMVVMPKKHEPHFYSFDLDELEEFGYLIKKVSFWAMRSTMAPGFTMAMSDGTIEVAQADHLQIHILPRQYADDKFPTISQTISQYTTLMDEVTLAAKVKEMQGLMQLPQNQT